MAELSWESQSEWDQTKPCPVLPLTADISLITLPDTLSLPKAVAFHTTYCTRLLSAWSPHSSPVPPVQNITDIPALRIDIPDQYDLANSLSHQGTITLQTVLPQPVRRWQGK